MEPRADGRVEEPVPDGDARVRHAKVAQHIECCIAERKLWFFWRCGIKFESTFFKGKRRGALIRFQNSWNSGSTNVETIVTRFRRADVIYDLLTTFSLSVPEDSRILRVLLSKLANDCTVVCSVNPSPLLLMASRRSVSASSYMK